MMQYSKPNVEQEEKEEDSSSDDEEQKKTPHFKSGENALYALKKICDKPFRTTNNLSKRKVEKLTKKIDGYKKVDLKVAIYHHIWKTQIEEFKKYLYNKMLAIKMAPYNRVPTQLPENIESRQGTQDHDNLNTIAETNNNLNTEDPNAAPPDSATPFVIKEHVQSEKAENIAPVRLDISEGNRACNQMLDSSPPGVNNSCVDKIEPGTQRQDEGYGLKCSPGHHNYSDGAEEE